MRRPSRLDDASAEQGCYRLHRYRPAVAGEVKRSTIFRTIGAATKTVGNAQTQAMANERSHIETKLLIKPKFTSVKMPDMMNAINIDMKNANSSGVYLAGIFIIDVSRAKAMQMAAAKQWFRPDPVRWKPARLAHRPRFPNGANKSVHFSAAYSNR